MTGYRLSRTELCEKLTGLVVESLSIKQDFGTATVGCRRCGETLAAGDSVRVAVSCYQDYSWEIEGVYCKAHDLVTVLESMGIRAENQAVIAATLELSPYNAPRGNTQTDALSLGTVRVLDYSPTATGY